MTYDEVDLPDPFGPMMAATSPLLTVRSSPLRMRLSVDLDDEVLDFEHCHIRSLASS